MFFGRHDGEQDYTLLWFILLFLILFFLDFDRLFGRDCRGEEESEVRRAGLARDNDGRRCC